MYRWRSSCFVVETINGNFHMKYPDFDGHNGFNNSALVAVALKVGFRSPTIETFFHDSKTANGQANPYSLFILDAMK